VSTSIVYDADRGRGTICCCVCKTVQFTRANHRCARCGTGFTDIPPAVEAAPAAVPSRPPRPPNIRETFPQVLALLRRARGKSQRELGKKARFNRTYQSKETALNRGAKKPLNNAALIG